jgi:copper(I)-binding protein
LRKIIYNYFIIDNRTNQADTLLQADRPQAGMTQVHLTQIDAAGKASMGMKDNVPVEAGKIHREVEVKEP